jgi:hypothetical protein
MKTIQVTKELISDLIPIVDDRIHFITENLYRNPGFLGAELKRLQEFFEVIEKLDCEK